MGPLLMKKYFILACSNSTSPTKLASNFYQVRYNIIMERKIREYEQFIAKATSEKLDEKKRERLARYHYEMMESFQHERIIHLIVTLFFSFVTIVFLFIAAWATVAYDLHQEMIVLLVLTAILATLTGFYVKHYYFLENHIQNLYRYTKKLSGV